MHDAWGGNKNKNKTKLSPWFFILSGGVVLTFCRLRLLGALEEDLVVDRYEVWRFFSCMFLHAGVVHLLANMFSLLFIGVRLEKEFGFCKAYILLSF